METHLPKKTIAFLHDQFPAGGAETVTLQLCQQFRQRGYLCYVFAAKYDVRLQPTINHFPEVITLPHTDDCRKNAGFIVRECSARSVNVLIVCHRGYKSILHLFQGKSPAKVLYFWHATPWAEKDMRLAGKSPSVWSRIHCLVTRKSKEYLFATYTRRYKSVYREIANNCDAMLTLHEDYSHQLADMTGVTNTPTFSIPNFIADEQFEDIRNMPKENVILYCGRFTYPDKRLDQLLRIWTKAYDRLPTWRLIFVGDGPMRKQLEKQVASNKLPRVCFEGWQKDTAPYYRRASIVCLTSHVESFGMCLVEGMAKGCIPFAFDCSAGVRDIVAESGFLFEPGDIEGYAEQLIRLSMDKALLKEREILARKSAERFSASTIMSKWESMLSQLCN